MTKPRERRTARIKAAAITNGLLAFQYGVGIDGCPYPSPLRELYKHWRGGWFIGMSISKKTVIIQKVFLTCRQRGDECDRRNFPIHLSA